MPCRLYKTLSIQRREFIGAAAAGGDTILTPGYLKKSIRLPFAVGSFRWENYSRPLVCILVSGFWPRRTQAGYLFVNPSHGSTDYPNLEWKRLCVLCARGRPQRRLAWHPDHPGHFSRIDGSDRARSLDFKISPFAVRFVLVGVADPG